MPRRYASMRNYDSNSATPSTSFQTAVQNMVVYGNAAGTGSPVAAGLAIANVQVLPNMKGVIPESITVQINNFAVNAVFGTYTFNTKPSTTFPYTGTPEPTL